MAVAAGGGTELSQKDKGKQGQSRAGSGRNEEAFQGTKLSIRPIQCCSARHQSSVQQDLESGVLRIPPVSLPGANMFVQSRGEVK